jgi:DNA-binding NarL/FixJ family response regulator
MADVFVIGVLASLDAGLLAAAVVLLGRPRPAHQLLAFLVGCMGFSIIFGLVIVFVLHGSRLLRHPDPSVSAVIEIAAGALLIVVAVAVVLGRNVQWRPHRHDTPRPEHQSLSDRAVGHDSLWIAWAAGALYSAPGAYYLTGLALLVKLDEPIATNVVAIVGFNLIMFAFIELPLLGFVLAPERARTLTEKLNGWMTRHKRTLITVVAGVGARVLAARAHDALVAAGARPRRDPVESRNALTASELRVARIAAEGLTNREIAQSLSLTEKTIEVHLTRGYRTLDINSRSQLARALPAAPGV